MDSFNGKLRDELLDRELFLSLPEARVVLDQWRVDYKHKRPHGGGIGRYPRLGDVLLIDKYPLLLHPPPSPRAISLRPVCAT